ncbi:short transient receptor potential channel 4-like [Saccoglossus kowalevskii]
MGTKEWTHLSSAKDGMAPNEAKFISMVESGEEHILIDDLRYSIFCELASPAYLSLANSDPVVASMDLASDLQRVTEAREIQMTSVERYIELKNKVQEYTLDLLDCCESSEEVSTLILGCNEVTQLENELPLKGKVVTKAIATKHKKFIAHYKCQNVLRKVWHKGQPEWHCKNSFWWWFLYCIYCLIVYVLLMPLLAVIYIIAPCSPVAKILDNPKAKFIMQMVAYFEFLLLVILLNIELDGNLYYESAYAHFIIFLLIYVIALIWCELRKMMICGRKHYFTSVWNNMNILILFSFLADICLRFISLFQYVYINPRVYIFWITWTAFTLTLACLRFMENFYLSFYLGPMLLMFTSMTGDVIRFLIIFLYTVTAFALGFYYLYEDFGEDNVFSEFSSSFVALVTTIFGGNPTESLKADDLYFNFTGPGYEGILDAGPMYEAMGFILYASFGTLCMLVLVNIFIAMMSDTYARIKQNIKVEYAFMRTKIWLSYVDAPVLPAPYNIIPSVSCLIAIIKRFLSIYSSSTNVDVEVRPTENNEGMFIINK